eukprot:264716-Karenia_brevis.AAC.1
MNISIFTIITHPKAIEIRRTATVGPFYIAGMPMGMCRSYFLVISMTMSLILKPCNRHLKMAL